MQEIKNKEVQRTIARAKRLKIAASLSPNILGWSREEVDHMAEAATLLWDQAQILIRKHPEFTPDLNYEIAAIFEPLLMFTGQFDLAAKLALSRLANNICSKEEKHEIYCFRFLMLALKFRYLDEFPWTRQATGADALSILPMICTQDAKSEKSEQILTKNRLFVALGLDYLGLESMSLPILAELQKSAEKPNLNAMMPTPEFWRQSFASQLWAELAPCSQTRT